MNPALLIAWKKGIIDMKKNMIKNKIKALLLATNKTQSDIAKEFKITRQTFGNKLSRETFKVKDLIRIANATGTTLAFVDKDGVPVIKFDNEDIKKTGSR